MANDKNNIILFRHLQIDKVLAIIQTHSATVFCACSMLNIDVKYYDYLS
jgi:hypothetical protein